MKCLDSDNKRKDFYTKESELYDIRRFSGRGGAFYQEQSNRIISTMLKYGKADRVIEIAVGTGRVMTELAKHTRWVVGLDLTENMLKQSKDKTNRKKVGNISLSQANAKFLPYKDNSFDAAVSIRFFHLLSPEERQKCFEEIYRVLKPGGILIVEFNSWLYGLLIPLFRCLFKDDKRIRYFSPNQIEYIVPKGHVIKLSGVGFPFFLGTLSGFNKPMAVWFQKILENSFLKYLASQIIVKWQKKR